MSIIKVVDHAGPTDTLLSSRLNESQRTLSTITSSVLVTLGLLRQTRLSRVNGQGQSEIIFYNSTAILEACTYQGRFSSHFCFLFWRDRQTDRQTETQTARQRERQTDRQRQREKETETKRQTETDRQI